MSAGVSKLLGLYCCMTDRPMVIHVRRHVRSFSGEDPSSSDVSRAGSTVLAPSRFPPDVAVVVFFCSSMDAVDLSSHIRVRSAVITYPSWYHMHSNP